jgi:WD40 repeat protein
MSRSKTPVVTYDPRLSNLTTMSLFHPLPQPNTLPHQLRPPSLLSASLAHGLAARSDVTNGKVSKGYLDPWGTTDHTSLWQPPAHASPPTVLALASKRETPTIVWGFAEGGVGCTLVAGYATGNGKTSAKTFHAVAGEGHEGPVVALSGAKDGSIVLSGGADGRVILWAVPPPSAGRVQSTLQRLWVGRATADERAARETVRRVCWDERAGGTVASVTDSGVVTVWTGVVGAAGSDPAEGSSRQALWVDDELRASAVGDRDRTVTLVLDVEDLLPSSATGTENSTAAVTIRVLLHATPSDSFKQLAITFPADRSETPLVVPTVFAPPSAGGTELTCFHTELAVPLPPGLPFQHSTSLAPTPALSRIPSSDAVALAPGPPATVATDAEERQILRLPMSTSIERRTLGSVGQGKFLVTGDGEGVVRLWNWDDGRLVRQWRAIDGKVTALECTMGLVLVGRCVSCKTSGLDASRPAD